MALTEVEVVAIVAMVDTAVAMEANLAEVTKEAVAVDKATAIEEVDKATAIEELWP